MATFKSNFTPRTFVPKQTSLPDATQNQGVPTNVALNDPYQLNTALDVLFNTAGLKKAYGNSSLKSRITAVGDILKNQYWKPISQGDFGTAGINTLYGLGETLDVIGNVPKALLAPYIDRTTDIDYDYARQMVAAVQDGQAHKFEQSDGSTTYTVVVNGKATGFNNKDLKMYESIVNSGRSVNTANMTTSERFKASIGYGEYGRINFQADTGLGLLPDIVTELVLDPTTWVSFGASTIGKTVAGKVDDVLKVFAKQADDAIQATVPATERAAARAISAQLIDETSRKKIAQEVMRTLNDKTIKIEANNGPLNDLVQSLLGNAVKTNNAYNTYAIKDAAAAIQYVLAKQGMPVTALSDNMVKDILQRATTKRINSMTVNIARSLDATNNAINKTQGILAKAALSPTGVYPIYAIAKKASPAVAALVYNTLRTSDEVYSNAFGNRPLLSYFDSQLSDENTARVITDMLPDDVKFLFRQPERVRMYETQLNQDVAYFDEWCRVITPDNALEKIEELRVFIRKSQGVALEDLPAAVRTILTGMDETNIVFARYADYVNTFIPRVLKYADKAQALRELTTLDSVFKTLHSAENVITKAGKTATKVSPLLQHHVNLRKAVIDMLRKNEKVTVTDFAKLLKAQQDATMQALLDTLEPLRLLGNVTTDYAMQFIRDADKLLLAQSKKMLKNIYSVLGDAEVYRYDDYVTLMEKVFGKEVQKTFNDEMLNLLTPFEKQVGDYYISRTKAVKNLIRPESVLDVIGDMQLDAKSKFSVIVSNMHTLAAKHKAAKVNDEVGYMKMKMCTPAGMFPAETYKLRNVLRNEGSPALDTLVKDWMLADIDSKEYLKLYNDLEFIIFTTLHNPSTPEAKAQLLQDALGIMQAKLNPAKRIKEAERLVSYEEYIAVTQENFRTLVDIVSDPDVNKFTDALRTGEFGNLLRDIEGNELYSEKLQQSASELLTVVTGSDKLKHLVFNIAQSDMRVEAKATFFATIMKFWNVQPEAFESNMSFFVDNFIEAMPKFTQYSKQYKRRLSINALMQDPQYTDTIREVYEVAGQKMPTTELHTGSADIPPLFGIVYKEAETNPTLKAIVENNLILGADSEASGTSIFADVTTTHQLAFQAQKQKKQVCAYSQSVSDDIINQSAPGRDYQLDLYDASQHTEANKARDKYSPMEDYTTSDVDLLQFYKDHLVDGNTEQAVSDEAELYLNFFQKMYKTISENATYDVEKKMWNVTMLVQNGDGFDIPLWKNKINQHNLYEIAAKDPRYGFDLHFLDRIQIIDTWDMLKKYDDYFELTGFEEAEMRKALMQYAEGIGDCGKLFTPLTIHDLNRAKKLLGTMRGTPELSGVGLEVYEKMYVLLDKAKKPLMDVYNANRNLGAQHFPADILRGKTYRSQWNNFMKREMNLSAEEIEKTFGKNMDNMQLSSIFAIAGDYQSYAYTWKVVPKIMDRWFIGTFTRTQLGQVSSREAARLTKIGKILSNIADHTRYLTGYSLYQEDLSKVIKTMLADKEQFGYLKYLRTEGLNTAETWAVFKYLSSKCDERSLSKYITATADIDLRPKTARALLDIPDEFHDIAEDKFARMMQEDGIETALAYTEQINALMRLETSYEAFSHWSDNNGLISSAATIQIKALEPIHNLLVELKEGTELLEATAPGARAAFFKVEREVTDELSCNIAKQFMQADAESTVRWLSRSKAHVLFNITSFSRLGGYETYQAFLQKLNNKEFKALNIEYVEDGKSLVVYLNRKADFKVRLDAETGEKFYYVNGEIVPDFDRMSIDAQAVKRAYEGVVDLEHLQNAIDSADFMTEGAVRGSLYDMYGQDLCLKNYEKFPQKMLDNFYTADELCAPALWDASNYNYTVLGTVSDKAKYGIKSSGRFISAMRNAAEYKMNEQGVKNVYIQSMLSDMNALQNTEMKHLIEVDDVHVAKWHKENPDYTAAALVADKKHKQGYKVIECDMTTPAGVRKALALNAKIVTYSEYNKLYEVINSNIFSESSIRGWQKLVRMFKIGYLVSPGTWARNGIDAYLKNMSSTETNPLELSKYYHTAMKDISNYDRVVMELKGLGNGHFPVEGEMISYFKGCGLMDYDKFKVLNNFFSDPAAGGESMVFTKLNSASRKKYLSQLHDAGHITTDEMMKKRTIESYNNFSNLALAPMNSVERISRLAAYQALTQKGFTNTTALRMVEQTHFAYSVKSETEQMLELLIPFYTFASRNFVYWMDLLDSNPRYFAMLRDVLEPALNLEQYSQEEMENNKALQRSVMSGNIKVTDDYYWSLSMSFMDTLKWITNPVGQAKNAVFTPVQAFVNVWLQNAADENYLQGQEALSNWMQNTFGLKVTKEQVEAQYGAWAAEYEKLFSYRISNLDPTKSALDDLNILQLVPLIGSQLQRLETTGVYFDEGDGLKSMLYAAGLVGKVNRWEDVRISKDVNQDIHAYLQNEDTRNIYTRLKDTLGYKGVALADLPLNVKETILSLLQGTTPSANTIPVLQDGDAISFMWTALKRQYDVAGTNFADIDKTVLNSMYKDIAASVTRIGNMYEMLSNDPASRISYSILKKKLGLEGLKIYQMPLDALEVMEFAMQKHLYGTGYSKKSYSSNTQYRKRSYATKTYAPGGNSPGYHGGYSGQTPYDTSKGVYANYGHTSVQKQQYNDRTNFYEDHYAQSGVSRMKMAMIPITPENLPSRVKDMFYYYK